MTRAIEQPSAFDNGHHSSQSGGKPPLKPIRPALAASLGCSRRRFVDRGVHREVPSELDETSVDVAFVLRLAGIWSSLSRAQRSRIKRMPPLHVTTVTPVDIGSGRQPKR
ncbi:hypothetical protein P6U16_00505 [Rhizobium sp. 32-5/1]|uniref:hypothetical protein n=1 Tax=Rhizobium sp. 32-5/1 TaxID=3019602 RepID=UPI00240D6849|nr:hypothetical protein [Rhizobium sp. 32-5/1]WEZ83411.1 hypothetical protein P6U16_00505 [Rhizobium sp. 32-5/1]